MNVEKHNEYYEGILQLRNPSKEAIDFVEKQIEKRKNVFIAKAKKVKNGIDFYISSQKYLQSLGKKLQNQFSGELKISSKLFSRNHLTSKNIYRVNVLFRLPKFKKSDIITFKGEDIKILGIGKKVLAKNLKTGKKHSLRYKELSGSYPHRSLL